MQPKPFIVQCKAIAKQHGWSGYTPDNHIESGVKSALVALINTVSDRKTLHRKICNVYPNKGTYTFTDGVVDYVLGLLMQPTPGVMPLDQKAAAIEVWIMTQMGVPEKQISAIHKEKLKEYL